MMNLRKRLKSCLRVAGASLLIATITGCQSYLAFGTATKFGLDISQRPDQKIDVTMGYRRAEMASIPIAAQKKDVKDADGTNDAYSVLARFGVNYDPSFGTKSEGLHLRQFFATGMAARKAAGNPDMQKAFGKAAFEVKKETEKK